MVSRAIVSELIKLRYSQALWLCGGFLAAVSFVDALARFGLSEVSGRQEIAAAMSDMAGGAFGVVGNFGYLVMACVGAWATGSEFTNGTWPCLLVHEPRRSVLWLAKLAGITLVGAALALATGVGGGAGFGVAVLAHGVPPAADWSLQACLTWLAALAQGALIMFAAGVAGAALGIIAGSTSRALAIGVGLLAVSAVADVVVDQAFGGTAASYLFVNALENVGTLFSKPPESYALPEGAAVAVVITYVLVLVAIGGYVLRQREWS